MKVRRARPEDAAAIASIYNEGIEDRIATFETEPREADSIRRNLSARSASSPAIVVEREGAVSAFGWTAPYRSRACYRGVAEFSVYVAREARASGAGSTALRGLIEAAEAAGLWKLVSRVFPENEASRRLCARLGFREVGVYRRHAKLEGSWRDCVIVEKLIGEAAS